MEIEVTNIHTKNKTRYSDIDKVTVEPMFFYIERNDRVINTYKRKDYKSEIIN